MWNTASNVAYVCSEWQYLSGLIYWPWAQQSLQHWSKVYRRWLSWRIHVDSYWVRDIKSDFFRICSVSFSVLSSNIFVSSVYRKAFRFGKEIPGARWLSHVEKIWNSYGKIFKWTTDWLQDEMLVTVIVFYAASNFLHYLRIKTLLRSS